jgi:hypothetical protein
VTTISQAHYKTKIYFFYFEKRHSFIEKETFETGRVVGAHQLDIFFSFFRQYLTYVPT